MRSLRRSVVWSCFVALLLVGAASGALGADPPAAAGDVAIKAKAVLQEYCYKCHSQTKKVPDFDLSDREGLLKGRQELSNGVSKPFAYIVPGKPEASRIWQMAGGEDPEMPPKGKKPSAEERAILREWITAGAAFPGSAKRKFVSDQQVLEAIRTHLSSTKASERRYQRYFTFTHVHNNAQRFSDDDLRLFKAALSKVLNSVSYQPDIVLPAELPGTDGCVYVVDISQLGWRPDREWRKILSYYPYGMLLTQSPNQQVAQIAADVSLFSDTSLPYIRADWFVVFASQPPLYHDLLRLPASGKQLERDLGVDVEGNILSGKYPQIARAAFAPSGVSKQNRLVERHASKFGYYWRSYDFKPRKAQGDLIRFPLGPQFPENPFRRTVAFAQDGGEIIFSLPNHLQGYLLVKANDDRLDDPAPADIVFDSNFTAGTPAIVNGLSCMVCHSRGMIKGFRDEARDAGAVRGNALDAVVRLFPTKTEMDRLLDQDEEQYLLANRKATASFLEGYATPAGGTEIPEPISRVAAFYLADLGPTEIALELGLEPANFVPAVRNRELLRLGLGTLTQNPPGTIKREKWEALSGTSLFQDVAVELQIGAPLVPN